MFTGGYCSFFSRLKSTIAIGGFEKTVYGISGVNSQILQICSDYNGLPNIKDLELYEIRFFYKPLIQGLIEAQKS